MFEAIATREDWPQGEWARVLAPLLTGELQRAYFTLSPEQRESYEELRKEILAQVSLSPICACPVILGLGIQDTAAHPHPGRRTHAVGASLAARRGSYRQLSRRACRHRQTSSSSPSPPQTGSWYAESAHHRGTRGGYRAGGYCPTQGCWGASAAIPLEGGPGATRVVGHLTASKQACGFRPTG